MVHASGGDTGVMLSWSFSPMAFISPSLFCLLCGKVLRCLKYILNRKTSTLHTHSEWDRGVKYHVWKNVITLCCESDAEGLIEVLFVLQLTGMCLGYGVYGNRSN